VLLGVQGQFHAFRGRGRTGASLNHGVGRQSARLLDADLEQAAALATGQRPPLTDAARQPEHVVTQRPDAVADQGAVRLPVDVFAVAAAKGRVERIADAAQASFGGPGAGISC
jgi:hypothetical protein